MDHVVEALDELVSTGQINEEVIIQSAQFRRRPLHAQTYEIVPHDQLAEWARRASVVITHGGPGSVMLALSSGHRPVVIPRDPAFDEHVDDHQLRFAHWLAARRSLVVVHAMAELGRAIAEARSPAGRASATPFVPQAAIDRLRQIVNGR